MSSPDFLAFNDWTLFLDRDGVINKRKIGEYVRNLSEFEFLPGVIPALNLLSKVFGRIVIVTNQQGIGKGLMTSQDLESIHEYMLTKIHEAGGRIDHIYVAPQLENQNSPLRKPNIGMARSAKKDFPAIQFSKSIMVGDSITDLQFGRSAGMITVYLGRPEELQPELADHVFESLEALVKENRLEKIFLSR